MTNKQVVDWLQAHKLGSQWNLSGDINNQDDLDNHLVWLDLSGKPSLSDLGL